MCIKNEIISENSKNWPKTEFLTNGYSNDIKEETNYDLNSNEENICIEDEILDENGQFLSKDEVWKSHTAKEENSPAHMNIQRYLKQTTLKIIKILKCDCVIKAPYLERLLKISENLYI
ncbi:hypothetical protein WA026_005078 [Henosepilachna vigintioctopunctata]|uniref:Uncharacterized protein n=1 Tax=Henosepilachna vigintioctopunctata TaxID=420089 RepID=A0AAW1UNL5_9CUCU